MCRRAAPATATADGGVERPSPPGVGLESRRSRGGRLSGANAALHRGADGTTVNRMVQYPPSVDRAFVAIADPTRRAVLERLGAGSASISELAEPFGMSLTGMKK